MKDHRYRIHPSEKFLLRLRNEPKSLRTQYQVQNNTEITRNQKDIKNNNDELTLKNYPKNEQPIQRQQKFKPPVALLVHEILGWNLIKVSFVKKMRIYYQQTKTSDRWKNT